MKMHEILATGREGNKLHSIRILKLKTFKELKFFFDMSVLADLLKIGGRKDLTTRILQRTNKFGHFAMNIVMRTNSGIRFQEL